MSVAIEKCKLAPTKNACCVPIHALSTLESAFDNRSAANRAHQVALDKERKARVRIEAELRHQRKGASRSCGPIGSSKKVQETELVMIQRGKKVDV